MPLPRPSSPRALWADLRAFWSERSGHRWIAGGLATIVPAAIIIIFYLDSMTNLDPSPQLIYVESWPANRTDAEIKAKQEADMVTRRAAQEERRRQFQRLEDGMNRVGL